MSSPQSVSSNSDLANEGNERDNNMTNTLPSTQNQTPSLERLTNLPKNQNRLDITSSNFSNLQVVNGSYLSEIASNNTNQTANVGKIPNKIPPLSKPKQLTNAKQTIPYQKISAKPIPDDCIVLKLMIVTGNCSEFVFSLKTPASAISEHVWSNWPSDWPIVHKTNKSETLRLIYQGRFLHGNVTLGALKLVAKRTVVMHLVHREKLPTSAPDELNKDPKQGGSGSGDGNGNGYPCSSVVAMLSLLCCCSNNCLGD